MRRVAAAVLMFVVAPLALTGCANDLSRAEAVESFQAANPDASTVEAACVIDALIEEYEADPVDEAALAGLETELLAEPQRERFLREQFRVKFACGMTDGVEAQLRRELLANEIDGDAVECVAAELTGQLTDADLDLLIGAADVEPDAEASDGFYARFFGAVERCDALPS